MDGYGPAPTNVTVKPLGQLIGAFKTVSAKQINLARATPGAQVWQRDYYEHIIRNETEWERIHTYIQANPVAWESDQLHPAAEINRFNQDQR